jgi:hypothetical protein
MKRTAQWLFICLVFVAAVALGERLAAPVTLAFPDFPEGAVTVELGQSLTIKVMAVNDGGNGVTWTCAGDACTNLTSTSKWATFYASGITGTATITATSKKQPGITKSIRVTVLLNAVPNVHCG